MREEIGTGNRDGLAFYPYPFFPYLPSMVLPLSGKTHCRRDRYAKVMSDNRQRNQFLLMSTKAEMGPRCGTCIILSAHHQLAFAYTFLPACLNRKIVHDMLVIRLAMLPFE